MTATSEETPAPGRGRVLAIVGPTGVGKSDVAELVCGRCSGEVVAADSMQVYRGMDIGTAKGGPDRRGVPHHCIDLVDPGTPYSAALYQRDARRAIEDAHSRGVLPVVVGGTGLYVRAALDDWDFPPGHAATERRAALEAQAAEEGPAAMHEHLRRLDPDSAEAIHPHNTRRVLRALEMIDDGMSYAAGKSRFAKRVSLYDTLFVGLDMEREALYRRIEERVDEMVERGLVAEVQCLLASGYRDALTASQAIGYKELVPVLEAGAPLAGAIESIKRATRRYAKRQLTWFRADPRVQWVDVTGLPPAGAADVVFSLLESAGEACPQADGDAEEPPA